ncbi:hypothetical protein REPUB_Repub07fG0160500 [Reevesia pubescens]
MWHTSHLEGPVPMSLLYLRACYDLCVAQPDIAAPGVEILAAIPPFDQPTNGAFAFLSGTSMATPHVSGIVALLKSLYQDCIDCRSIWRTNFAQGETKKLADPFDFGGGIVNPNGAADPGLVYDKNTEDYVQYLCDMGYSNSAIFQLKEHPVVCPSKQPSIMDVNLPSITIPSLRKPTILTRTVTNVGPVNSKYKANVGFTSGINITVRPETLIFNSKTKTTSFFVMISSAHNVNAGYYFGSLTWTDGVHDGKKSNISGTEVEESFY